MKKYKISGMSCAACVARVEKAVGALEGVAQCSVNLLTNSMAVEGDASDGEIILAVEKAGYGAEPAEAGAEKSQRAKMGAGKETDPFENREIPILRNRLIASAGFLLVLMYLSMGHLMWGLPLPRVLLQNPAAQALLQMLLSATVLIINQKFFISGVKGLLHKAPNMDTLVALGSGASFLYSTYALFQMTAALTDGQIEVREFINMH